MPEDRTSKDHDSDKKPLSETSQASETETARFMTHTHARQSPGSTLTVPQQIGNYKILEVLGQGGMGVVYLAEQTGPIRRRVALKLVKLGMDTKQVIARFESERQALAMLDHPYVAKVFDAGSTEQGRPYFVMEYVAGVPITEYCDTHRLNTTDRLQLFMQVCHAVQHAHQKGIIHRDIKPSNVLVTLKRKEPEPKVIDFGVAKATQQELTDKTLFTVQGQLIGTPEYMSPEQAEMTALDIDTRTDIYSLGVMLYQLLAGALPFEPEELRRAGFAEIQRVLREQEPTKPSTRLSSLGDESTVVARKRHTDRASLQKQLRGDLDWITMKSLEKDRSRRYDTASEFADDIGRHLRHEPVLASPPSTIYGLRKFVRRNKELVGGLTAIFLALAIGLGFSIQFYLRSEKQRQRATLAEAESSTRLVEAEAVIAFLDETLASADPRKAASHGRTVKAMLDSAAIRLKNRFKDQPLLQAKLQRTLGSAYRGLGAFANAEDILRKAVQTQRRVLGADNSRTLRSRLLLVQVLRNLGKLDEAETLARTTFETARRSLGNDHPLTVESMNLLGFVLVFRGKHVEAEELCRKTLALSRRVLGESSIPTLDAMNNLGLCLRQQSKFKEAAGLFRDLIVLAAAVRGEKHPVTLWSMNHLATVLTQLGEYTEAEELHRRTLALRREVLGDEHPETLNSLVNLSILLMKRGQFDEAEKHLRYAVARRVRVMGEDNEDGAWWLEQYVLVLLARDKLSEARPFTTELIGVRAGIASRPDADPTALNSYAMLLLTCFPTDLRNSTRALSYAVRADKLTKGRDAAIQDTLALANYENGNLRKAIGIERQALQLVSASQPSLRASVEQQLETFLRSLGDCGELEKFYRSTLKNRAIDEAVAEMLRRFGQFLVKEQRYAEAEPQLRRCLEFRIKYMKPSDWRISEIESVLGSCLAGLGKQVEAERLLTRSYTQMKAHMYRIPYEIRKRRLRQAIERTITFYQAVGAEAKAAEWTSMLHLTGDGLGSGKTEE